MFLISRDFCRGKSLLQLPVTRVHVFSVKLQAVRMQSLDEGIHSSGITLSKRPSTGSRTIPTAAHDDRSEADTKCAEIHTRWAFVFTAGE